VSRAPRRRVLLLVESNTSGTGRLFVQAARALDLHPVLVTARPGKYAYLSQDGAPEVAVVPRVDEGGLHSLARRYAAEGEVAGVTSSSEYFVATAAALAARLGLPGPDAGRVRAARDKSHQRQVLAAGGVATPGFRVAASAPAAVLAAREIGFPVVVKPVAGSGSVGVRRCDTALDVGRHAAALLSTAVGDERRVLVEELVAGDEFSVEMLGDRVIGITRKHLGAPPHFVEAGHDYPAAVPAEVADALAGAAVRGTELLGLGWGPLHWEIRVRDGCAVPIEVNPRLAGGFIPELVRHAQGIDLVRETVRLAVGGAPRVDPLHHRHASIRFLFAPAAGRLASVDGADAALGRANVVDVALYRGPGDDLVPHGDFRDRIGHVLACADHSVVACAAAERARDAIRVRIEPAGGTTERAGNGGRPVERLSLVPVAGGVG
jgi:biotin carboxylase